MSYPRQTLRLNYDEMKALENHAHQLRAEALSAYGKTFRNWVKGLFTRVSIKTA